MYPYFYSLVVELSNIVKKVKEKNQQVLRILFYYNKPRATAVAAVYWPLESAAVASAVAVVSQPVNIIINHRARIYASSPQYTTCTAHFYIML